MIRSCRIPSRLASFGTARSTYEVQFKLAHSLIENERVFPPGKHAADREFGNGTWWKVSLAIVSQHTSCIFAEYGAISGESKPMLRLP